MYDLRGEQEFDPPHGKEVFDFIFDGGSLVSFSLESGEHVTMHGSMRSFSISCGVDNDIPESVQGVFQGDYEVDDFIYPAEVHFKDTYGRIVERPRMIPECCWAVRACASHITFKDPSGTDLVCIREPQEQWSPLLGTIVGRIGHLLFAL